MTRLVTAAMIAATSLIAVAGAAPALARKGLAPVTLSSKSLQTPTSRLCMPRTTLGPKADRSLPETICQTRGEWEAAGVTFVVK